MSQKRSTKFNPSAGTATYSGYLVIDAKGAMKLSRTQPSLDPGEVSISLNLTVPTAVFQRPSLRANIVLPDNVGAADASAQVMLNLKNALRACPGVELKIGQ